MHVKAFKIRQKTNIGTGLKYPSLIPLFLLHSFCIAADLFNCCPAEMTSVRSKPPLHQTQSNQCLLKRIKIILPFTLKKPCGKYKIRICFYMLEEKFATKSHTGSNVRATLSEVPGVSIHH